MCHLSAVRYGASEERDRGLISSERLGWGVALDDAGRIAEINTSSICPELHLTYGVIVLVFAGGIYARIVRCLTGGRGGGFAPSVGA